MRPAFPSGGWRQAIRVEHQPFGERGSPRVSQGTADPLVLQKPPHACAYISRILALQAILQPTLTLPVSSMEHLNSVLGSASDGLRSVEPWLSRMEPEELELDSC